MPGPPPDVHRPGLDSDDEEREERPIDEGGQKRRKVSRMEQERNKKIEEVRSSEKSKLDKAHAVKKRKQKGKVRRARNI